MQQTSYPRPPHYTWTPAQVRTPLPVLPPPEPLPLPALPSPPRKPAFDAPFTLSTHIFPAAYLRTSHHVDIPSFPSENVAKAERHAMLVKMRTELKEMRGSTRTDGHPRVLWNCVNRYVRNDLTPSNSTGVTLFFAHANGFPKETWESVLAVLLSSPAGPIIDEVWAWESVQHGDAALINAGNLSAVFDWQDNARDIINFLLNYLPGVPSTDTLPTHLKRLPHAEVERRKVDGFTHRKFIAVGHSYGGCTSTLAAQMFPKLFSSLVLIDPVILKPCSNEQEYFETADAHAAGLTLGALMRRDTWTSKDEALAGFMKSPFFQAWDPDSLKLYVECGTYITKDNQGNEVAKLKMSGMLEAIVFSETHTEFEVFDRLPLLDERITLRWVMPGKEGGEFGPPGSARARVWVRPANSTNIRIPGAGHLIPQEAPKLLANDLRDFILRQYSPVKRLSIGAML